MPITEENQDISFIDFMEFIETNLKCKFNLKQVENPKINLKSAMRLNYKINKME